MPSTTYRTYTKSGKCITLNPDTPNPGLPVKGKLTTTRFQIADILANTRTSIPDTPKPRTKAKSFTRALGYDATRNISAFLDPVDRLVLTVEKPHPNPSFNQKPQYDKCMVELKRWFDYGRFNYFKKQTGCIGVNGHFTPFQKKKNDLRVAIGTEYKKHSYYTVDTYMNITRFQKIYPEYTNVRVKKFDCYSWSSILSDLGCPFRGAPRRRTKKHPILEWVELRDSLNHRTRKPTLVKMVSEYLGKTIDPKKYTVKKLVKMLMTV